MATSSSSSIRRSFKYDVYLSFRGEDTRKNFVDHLYYTLQQKGIRVYKDDAGMSRGRNLAEELIRSVKDSKIFIIVFSKNYASSTWCLDELVMIMESYKTMEQTAYPLFYDVEPYEVRRQTGAFGDAFHHYHSEKVAAEKWRKALTEAANLSGWELRNTADGHEAVFIDTIVKEISLKLQNNIYKYDVFLNFRGEDTRNKFVGHLYGALKRKGINTFKDSVELQKGRRIEELFNAIEESGFLIIVFSKNYASSSWCLRELAKIMECQKTTKQIAYPIFYDVDPSEFRDQNGAVGEEIAMHKNEDVGIWKEALKEACNLVGWDLKNRDEAEVIDEIVEDIALKMRSV